MSLTREQARDEMLALFKTAWGSTYNVLWDDVAGAKPAADEPYARATVIHGAAGQRTMGGAGARRFSRSGSVIVQVFVPRGRGLALADQLSKVAVDAFEAQRTPGDVWFRNVRANEIGGQTTWFQTNVIADFTYDEIK